MDKARKSSASASLYPLSADLGSAERSLACLLPLCQPVFFHQFNKVIK